MINYSTIENKFVSVCQLGVGSQLSQVGPPSAPEGAVIVARPEAPKPNYPYIAVAILDTVDEQGWETYVDIDANDNPIQYVYEKMLISLRCYGGDALGIINNLKHYLRLESVRDDIRSTLGGSIVEVLDIDSMPIKLADKYLESANINVVFNILTSVVDTATGVITNVNIGGEVFRDDQDTNPYTLNVIAP